MDTALFFTLFLFAVQIAAGVAPMRWPGQRWLAGAVFWLSMAGAVVCLIWFGYSNWGQMTALLDMTGHKTVGIAILILGAAIGVLGLSLIGSPPSQAQSPSLNTQTQSNNPMPNGKLGDINVNMGNNNSVGNIGHTIIAPARATFTDQVKADILRQFPKDKVVKLESVGSQSDMEIGNEVQAFLQQNGYSIVRSHAFNRVPMPEHPFSATFGAETSLIVAPSAR